MNKILGFKGCLMEMEKKEEVNYEMRFINKQAFLKAEQFVFEKLESKNKFESFDGKLLSNLFGIVMND